MMDLNKHKGTLTRVADYIPRQEELLLHEETIKITLFLKKSSVDFFKHKAKECHTKYQKMIRELVNRYAAQYSSIE